MRRNFIITLFLAFILCNGLSAQNPAGQQKAFLVKRMIELNHYSPRAVDDSFSISLFKAMINAADSRRLFFTASEYKQLSEHNFRLDDELQGKRWEFLDQLTLLYKKCLVRADSMITTILQKPFDFSLDESVIASKNETYNFAATSNELFRRWSLYLKFIALQHIYDIITDDSTNNTFSKEAIAKLEPGIRSKIRTAEKKAIKKILEHPDGFDNFLSGLYLNAIATSYDPHTNYFSPEGKEMFQSALSTEGYSFGLEFDEDEKGKIVIGHLAPGGPAWKSGELHKEDELLQLHWENKEPVDITGMSLDEIYDMVEQSTQAGLVLKVKKANGTLRTVTLRKEKMDNEENIVKSFVLKGEKKIGYILLPGFYTEWENESGSGCAHDIAKEIIKLKRENINGLIIDVRFNGGGSIKEGLEMTGIFVDEGPLGAYKDRAGKVTYYKDPNRGVIYDGPLALMVNSQSASASEMLAASLQDYNRAIIIGSNTYGKSTIQQMFPLDTAYKANTPLKGDETDVVKITFAKFYRLNGQSAQLNGIRPDVVLPDAFDGLDVGEEFYSNALASDTVKRNSYYRPLSPLPVNELIKRSAERINSSNDFQNIKKIITARPKTDQTGSEIIPLKWESFEKWMKQHELDLEIIEGDASKSAHKLQAENNLLDKQWLQNNDYEQEINKKWLENIEEDIYIREAFFVVCDLINLQKTPSKN